MKGGRGWRQRNERKDWRFRVKWRDVNIVTENSANIWCIKHINKAEMAGSEHQHREHQATANGKNMARKSNEGEENEERKRNK